MLCLSPEKRRFKVSNQPTRAHDDQSNGHDFLVQTVEIVRLTDEEMKAAEQAVIDHLTQAHMRVDPVLVDMNMRLRNMDLAIAFRVRRFFALNEPELNDIVKAARQLASDIILYEATQRAIA